MGLGWWLDRMTQTTSSTRMSVMKNRFIFEVPSRNGSQRRAVPDALRAKKRPFLSGLPLAVHDATQLNSFKPGVSASSKP